MIPYEGNRDTTKYTTYSQVKFLYTHANPNADYTRFNNYKNYVNCLTINWATLDANSSSTSSTSHFLASLTR